MGLPYWETHCSHLKQKRLLFLQEFDLFDYLNAVTASVVDPDPYVFGPPGSGSVSQRYGFGSFYHLENSKKNLDSKCFVTSLS